MYEYGNIRILRFQEPEDRLEMGCLYTILQAIAPVETIRIIGHYLAAVALKFGEGSLSDPEFLPQVRKYLGDRLGSDGKVLRDSQGEFLLPTIDEVDEIVKQPEAMLINMEAENRGHRDSPEDTREYSARRKAELWPKISVLRVLLHPESPVAPDAVGFLCRDPQIRGFLWSFLTQGTSPVWNAPLFPV